MDGKGKKVKKEAELTLSQLDDLVSLNEQAKSHSAQAIESSDDNRFMVGVATEKNRFSYDRDVITYCFLVVKPINRASSGHAMSVVIALAHPNGIISIVDIYGNKLLELNIPDQDEIIHLSSSTSQEEPFLAVLTANG